jgi:hypothetical protein
VETADRRGVWENEICLGLDFLKDDDVASMQKTGDKLAGKIEAPVAAMDGIAKSLLPLPATAQRFKYQQDK